MKRRAFLNRQLKKFRRNQRGTIAIMAAFILPVMVGAMALGGEISYRYHQQRTVQNAADVAAHFMGDAHRHHARRQSAGLQDNGLSFRCAVAQQYLRDLRGFTRAGGCRDYQAVALPHAGDDPVFDFQDGEHVSNESGYAPVTDISPVSSVCTMAVSSSTAKETGGGVSPR